MAHVGSDDKRSDGLFRWACLGVVTVFLAAVAWMLNDLRMTARQSTERLQVATQNVNEKLPEILAKSRESTELIAKNLPDVMEKIQLMTETVVESLPEIVERIDHTTEVIAELAEDIRQLKELAGLTGGKRDENLVAYANSLLKAVEASGGSIGVRKLMSAGLKNTVSAAEWVAAARKEALLLSVLVKSKKEMLMRLGKTKLGASWYIELPGKEPITLIEWLKENHAETKALG